MKTMLPSLESCGKLTQFERYNIVFEEIGRFVGRTIEKCIDKFCNAIEKTKEK